MRPRHVWTIFGLSLLLALATVSWLSWRVLVLERAGAEARRKALLEENIRLAVWQVESSLLPIIVRENARPSLVYQPGVPNEASTPAAAFDPIGFKARLRDPEEFSLACKPSPLLTEPRAHAFLNFQVDPDGEVVSPEFPGEALRDWAVGNGASAEALDEAAARLGEARGLLAGHDLLALVAEAESRAAAVPVGVVPFPEAAQAPEAQSPAQTVAPAEAQQAAIAWDGQRQELLNSSSYQTRVGTNRAMVGNLLQGKQVEASPILHEGLLHPIWIGSELLLVRRVAVGKTEVAQGCWLDWRGLKAALLGEISSLLPRADLVPRDPDRPGDPSRRLASLPIDLEPGEVPAEPSLAASALGLSLLTAWGGVLLAGIAVAALLGGAVSLSERRAAFVSAVTHELRTPLTTFRMYTEMLADGMVRDDQQKTRYLATLGSEALRLSHLVENVLAYARLERGRDPSSLVPTGLPELIARPIERLEERARLAGLRLDAPDPGSIPAARVLADPGAVEQILLNLVDNACKYAAGAPDAPIRLEVEDRGSSAAIRVRDRGPGIPPDRRRRLFRPFSKSATEAALSAPGVGLGLALSRRLARRMGGDLVLDAAVTDGACFELRLPVTS